MIIEYIFHADFKVRNPQRTFQIENCTDAHEFLTNLFLITKYVESYPVAIYQNDVSSSRMMENIADQYFREFNRVKILTYQGFRPKSKQSALILLRKEVP